MGEEDQKSDGEWWDAPARRSRSRVPLVVAALALAGAAASLFVIYGGDGRKAGTAAADASADAVAKSARPSPVEPDPAVLQPLTLVARTAALDDVFSSRIMNFAIALGATEPSRLTDAERALAGDDVRGALGERAFALLQDNLRAAKTVEHSTVHDEAALESLEIATAKLDNALLASRLPYFVDTSVVERKNRRLVLFNQYAIEASNLFASPVNGGARVRSVWIRRVDQLNWSDTTLGFVKPHRVFAVVLVDKIDGELTNHLLPALADGAPMPLAEDASASSASPGLRAIGDRAGAVARDELGSLPGVAPAIARQLGAALVERRALFARWNARVEASGSKIKPPPTLPIDAGAYAVELRGAVTDEEIASLRRIQGRLDAPDVKDAFRAFQGELASSIERHEVQHRLDQIRPIAVPREIDAMVPAGQGPSAERLREHIGAELSAYVAQIARDTRMPRTTYLLLFRFLAVEAMRGGAESYAAWVATEELVRELGIAGVLPLRQGGNLDETRLTNAYSGIVAVPPATLCAAASRVWARLFGAELAPLSSVSL